MYKAMYNRTTLAVLLSWQNMHSAADSLPGVMQVPPRHQQSVKHPVLQWPPR